jgi:acetyl-CoA carboxylase biotin carboxylase subunit
MLNKVVIANRGEIALRILRACHALGIQTVAVYSTADVHLQHVRLASEAVCIGPAQASESYLNIPAIISAAEITHAAAIHPGYGFLSESADFAERVQDSGFTFIGPAPNTIRIMGDKLSAITTMRQLKVPCVEGSHNALGSNQTENIQLARKIGYPILIKAASGSEGRGIPIVYQEDALLSAIELARFEALNSFKNNQVYLEKYLTHPRHIEVQILGDGKGNAIHLGERDCSLQRHNQKILEESPAPGVTHQQRHTLGILCVQAAQALNYRGVGTFEFLYQDDNFYFIEMNTRLPVEHPVTEMITGIDLVHEQIHVASGIPLRWNQKDINFRGHAIECRINAEDPETFMPSTGEIKFYHPPGGPGIRIDSHLYTGYTVLPYYDSLLAKVIAYGETRELALARLRSALEELVIEGVKTNISLHKALLNDPVFIAGKVPVNYLEQWLAAH